MTIPLPAEETPRVYTCDEIAFHSCRMCRHQKETVIRCGVIDGRGLDRIVHGVGCTQRMKRFFFDRAQNVCVNREAMLRRLMKRENGQNVVMAGDTGALRDEFFGGALKDGQRAVHGFLYVGADLKGCGGTGRR